MALSGIAAADTTRAFPEYPDMGLDEDVVNRSESLDVRALPAIVAPQWAARVRAAISDTQRRLREGDVVWRKLLGCCRGLREKGNVVRFARFGCGRSLSSCLESVGFTFVGQVDADDGVGAWGFGAVAEPFGVAVVVGLVSLVALLPTLPPSAAVDLSWGE